PAPPAGGGGGGVRCGGGGGGRGPSAGVQLEGKRAMTAAAFLRGQRGFIGAVLPDGLSPPP
ncbi:MAG: BA14K family protein, partial [Chloroflexota bacterium]